MSSPQAEAQQPAQRIRFIHALILVWSVGLAVRALPFRTLTRLMLRRRPAGPRPCRPEPIAALVRRAAAHCWPAPSCLARALVLCRLLLRRGLDAELVLGVEAGGGRLAAHAWVEHEGRILDPDSCQTARFAEIHRIGPHGLAGMPERT